VKKDRLGADDCKQKDDAHPNRREVGGDGGGGGVWWGKGRVGSKIAKQMQKANAPQTALVAKRVLGNFPEREKDQTGSKAEEQSKKNPIIPRGKILLEPSARKNESKMKGEHNKWHRTSRAGKSKAEN